MAISPYEHPRYFTGSERRAFVDGSTQKANSRGLSPAATLAVSSLDRLKDAMHSKYVLSLATGKIFDTVISLRNLLANPRPLARSLKQKTADLDAIAETWRTTDPDLYEVYEETTGPITEVMQSLPHDDDVPAV